MGKVRKDVLLLHVHVLAQALLEGSPRFDELDCVALARARLDAPHHAFELRVVGDQSSIRALLQRVR
jgi:hypothetical protein